MAHLYYISYHDEQFFCAQPGCARIDSRRTTRCPIAEEDHPTSVPSRCNLKTTNVNLQLVCGGLRRFPSDLNRRIA